MYRKAYAKQIFRFFFNSVGTYSQKHIQFLLIIHVLMYKQCLSRVGIASAY